MPRKLSKALGGERDPKACSLYPAMRGRMIFKPFRGEGWVRGDKHAPARLAQ
jgi:hypothetical protein